ncbi:hypothetical protein THAOC_22740, partial [Thalassiosira oceanica]
SPSPRAGVGPARPRPGVASRADPARRGPTTADGPRARRGRDCGGGGHGAPLWGVVRRQGGAAGGLPVSAVSCSADSARSSSANASSAGFGQHLPGPALHAPPGSPKPRGSRRCPGSSGRGRPSNPRPLARLRRPPTTRTATVRSTRSKLLCSPPGTGTAR